MPDKTFTIAQVQQHNTTESAWIVIDGDVYDVTKFLKFHPGGAALLAQFAGTDATEVFFDMHRTDVLGKYKRLRIGRLDTAAADRVRAVDKLIPGTLSNVPYAEHNSLQGWHSPIYNEDHKNFRIAVRKWFDQNVRDVAVQYGAKNKLPANALYRKMGAAGMLACHLAPSPVVAAACKKAGISLPGNLPWEKFDLHMEQIVHEEGCRVGVPGFNDGLIGGYSIAAPCIVAYGTDDMKANLLPQLLSGEKRICLAITEPFAGSDVANIKLTATKSADGSHYILNGVKKWMTAGMDSDYFVTAVRTGGNGLKGVSLLLVEKQPGLELKLIKTSYSASAGTAYVIYDNVKVPVTNVLGKENRGFSCIVNNFNHERWMIIVGLLGSSRKILEESLLWANQRKVFNKPLIAQPVIRAKISEMTANVEALSAWLDLVTYQMQNMDHKTQNRTLGGPIALLKFYATRITYLIADHSSQVFGGRAITRSGMGQHVERFARYVKYGAIYGGSEEIMVDLAAKQMLKRMPPNSRL